MGCKKTIVALSEKYNTDKKMNNGKKCRNGLLGHNYAELYDMFLKNKPISNMLEIGVSFGNSVKMWNEFFGKETKIYGIDINEKRFNKAKLESENINILIGDQKSEKFLNNNFSKIKFDLIVDDGSHRMKDQQMSFKVLFKFLNNTGLYVIEDLHTSNHKRFYDSENETTTLQLLKNIKEGKCVTTNYISYKEYNWLSRNIKSIDIVECGKYIIAFIEKI